MTILEGLVRQPWTWVGPRRIDDESPYYELRILELPDFFVAGDTPEETLAEAEEALRAFLESYVAEGELPTLPAPKWEVLQVLPIEVEAADPRAESSPPAGYSLEQRSLVGA